jgi:hypothetical protein
MCGSVVEFILLLVFDFVSQFREFGSLEQNAAESRVGVQFRIGDFAGMKDYLLVLDPAVHPDERFRGAGHDLEYAARSAEFPHQSTGDQWFDESQFESYRKLGYHVGMHTFQSASEHYDLYDRTTEFFDHMSALWFPPTREIAEFSTAHARDYASLLEKLRSENELSTIDPSMFPGLHAEVDSLSPTERNVFLYCSILIQFMERVYSDLRMHEDREHPSIQGWLRIFQAWARSPHFAQAWEGSKSTYSERFQRFYEDVIGPRPKPEIRSHSV